MAGVRYVPSPGGTKKVRRAVGLGLLNYLYRLEGASKANAPVRGGHRSYAPDGPVGGTLRRSIHSVVYVDGSRIAGAGDARGFNRTDENKEPLPDYQADGDIVGVVGTNCGYGVYVHNGTVYMTARPFILEALEQTRGEAPDLIRDGIRKALG